MASGNPRLDAILGGGFPAHGINLVVGPPSSGKTVLAQQYVFHNYPDRPAVYLTTVSEPLEKVLRYGQTMAFFDPRRSGGRCSMRMWVGCSAPRDCPGCWSASTRWSKSAGPRCSWLTASRRFPSTRPTRGSSGGSSTACQVT